MTMRISPFGLLCAVGGTGLWGLSFLIPLLMSANTPFEVSIGRYGTYGLVASLLFWRAGRFPRPRLTSRDWLYAGLFAFSGYFGCFTLLIYGMKYSGSAVSATIMGATPVAVAIYGNLLRKEYPFSRLAAPLLAIFAGILLLNYGRFNGDFAGGVSPAHALIGLGFNLAALACLTWFLVANLIFLKDNPRISPTYWTNTIGVVTLTGTALATVAYIGLNGPPSPHVPSGVFWRFLAGSLILGAGSSWLGNVCWNRACAILPAAIAGQMVVFWPVSGLVFAYLFDARLPGLLECAGILLAFGGVFAGLRVAERAARTA